MILPLYDLHKFEVILKSIEFDTVRVVSEQESISQNKPVTIF